MSNQLQTQQETNMVSFELEGGAKPLLGAIAVGALTFIMTGFILLSMFKAPVTNLTAVFMVGAAASLLATFTAIEAKKDFTSKLYAARLVKHLGKQYLGVHYSRQLPIDGVSARTGMYLAAHTPEGRYTTIMAFLQHDRKKNGKREVEYLLILNPR